MTVGNPTLEDDQAPGNHSPSAGEQRYFGAWIALILLLGLLIVNSLMGSLETKGEPIHQEEQSELRQVVSTEALAAWLERQGSPSQKELTTATKQGLDGPIAVLVAKTDTDKMAERLYAAMRFEQGEPVPPQRLRLLTTSSAAADNSFAKIYLSSKLTQTESDAISHQLPSEPFVFQLARLHAKEKAGLKVDRSSIVSVPKALAFLVLGGLGTFVILLLSLTVWIVYFNARKVGKLAPLGRPMHAITRGDADRLALRAVHLVLAFLIIALGVSQLSLPAGMFELVTGIVMIVFVFAIQGVPVAGKKIRLRDLGLTTDNLGVNILWGLGGFAAEIPLAVFAGFVGSKVFNFLPAPTHPAETALLNNPSPFLIACLLFLACVVAPFWEEICFRGLIFQGLARLMPSLVASAALDGLIFASIHPQGFALWGALAIVGGVSCALMQQTRSIVPSIVMHSMHNLALMVLTIIIS